MQQYFRKTCGALALLCLSTGALAQEAPKPEQIIKWRQSVYQTIGWECGRIRISLDKGFEREEVKKAADAIAAIANSGLGALYVPGTDKGKGWHDTTLKPEFFSNAAKATEIARSFVKEANDFARVAATGDAATVKSQFGKLTQTCKSCHDEFRKRD
ncbi:MAG: cytochrome c [Zoogloeaceae bacterium]|jgi:cytochrome c556|nr:cytochrome c [Zoogloeaceae bacterium]